MKPRVLNVKLKYLEKKKISNVSKASHDISGNLRPKW